MKTNQVFLQFLKRSAYSTDNFRVIHCNAPYDAETEQLK